MQHPDRPKMRRKHPTVYYQVKKERKVSEPSQCIKSYPTQRSLSRKGPMLMPMAGKSLLAVARDALAWNVYQRDPSPILQ